ncbi:MAG: hypothetical protein WC460_01210 [Patescibacteria group bacterium]
MPYKFELKPVGKIEKASVADEDVLAWIKTLQKEGFSNEEIDALMSKMNKLYRQKRRPNFIAEELEKFKAEYRKKNGFEMPQEMEDYFIKGLQQRFEK